MKFYQRLAGQLALLVLAAILPLVGVVIYLLQDQAANAQDEARQWVASAVEAIATDAERLVIQTERLAHYLASRREIREQDAAGCTRQLFEIQRLNPVFLDIVLVNRDGTPVCRSLPEQAKRVNYRDREWFIDAMQGKSGWGNPVVGHLTRVRLLTMARGITNEDGEVQSVLLISISLDDLAKTITVPKLPEHSVVTIINQTGIVIARSLAAAEWIGKNKSDTAHISDLFDHPDGIRNLRGLDGVMRVYALATIPSANWRISVGIPLSEILRPYEKRRMATWTAVAIAVVLTLGLAVAVSRNVFRPIRALADAAHAVAQGRLDAHVNETGPLEISSVARQFNSMVEALVAANANVKTRTEELQMANKELESFAYSVSHDLRAPLRSIDGFSQALIEDYADRVDDQAKDYLRRLRSASQRMALLIDDILKLSRVTRTEIVRKTLDLSALAHDVAAELKESQPERLVTVSVMPGAVVSADESLLRLVLQNLLANAWKFTGKKAQALVEFGYMPRDGDTAYFIRDNGAGFDMAYAGNLFAPFQRLHLATEFPGTGIGLAIVKHIVQRHGGKVWAEGAVGKGAAFYFTLPGPAPRVIETAHSAAGQYRPAHLTEEFAT